MAGNGWTWTFGADWVMLEVDGGSGPLWAPNPDATLFNRLSRVSEVRHHRAFQ